MRVSSGRAFAAVSLVALALVSPQVVAQDGIAVPVQRGQSYRLHVDEDLVEVPTLVLNSHFADVTGLRAEDFEVRLDAGKSFHPRAVRLEGDDSLELDVLVDASGVVTDAAVAELREALPALVPDALSSRDHVTLYAVDCGLFESSQVAMPAAAGLLNAGLSAVLANPELHRRDDGQNTGCHDSRRLWDAMAAVAGKMASRPGRRVLLVLTNGVDRGSANSWQQVREYADGLSVTVLAVRPPESDPKPLSSDAPTQARNEDPLILLCANTGGTVLGVTRQHPRGMLVTLRRAISMMRNRYVVYFPRPLSEEAGKHRIDVSIGDSTALVRPSGVVFPPKRKTSQTDPSAIPTDPTRAPKFGSRRILEPGSPH